jgi:hypothetical protein
MPANTPDLPYHSDGAKLPVTARGRALVSAGGVSVVAGLTPFFYHELEDL